MRRWGLPMLSALVCLYAPSSLIFAQTTPSLIFQGGAARDVVASPAGDRLYVALYSSDELVAIDAASGKELLRARVGDGPSAVIAANDAIAVLNRAGSSVSILSAADLSARATVTVSAGTNSLVAADAAHVAALDPFEATVTLIDLAAGTTTQSTELANTIPVGAAVASGSLMVASKSPALLVRLDASTLAETGRVTLSAAPRAIAANGSGFVAVATNDSLALIDAATMQVVRSEPIAVTSVTSAPNGVLCLAGNEVRLYNTALQPELAAAVPENARGARVVGSEWIAWSPELGRIWRVASGPVTVAAQPAPDSQPAVVAQVAPPAPTPESVQNPEPAAVAQAEPAPVAETPAPAPEPTPAPTPEPTPAPAAIEPAVEPTAEVPAAESAAQPAPETSAVEPAVDVPQVVAEAVAEEPAVPYHLTVHPSRPGLGGSRPYAPRFGDPTGRTIQQELNRALQVAADSDSLTNIDFSQPMVLKETNRLRRGTENGKSVLTMGPDAVFEIDQVHVEADTLRYVLKPQELILEGDVSLQRGDSALTADRIRAFNVPPIILTGRPLVPSNREKSIPHPLVPRGYKAPKPDGLPPLGMIAMDNVHWTEPGRHLDAESVEANSLARNADMVKPTGSVGPAYFGAERLRVLGPDEIIGNDFWITTCDDPVPHYRLRLSRVETQGDDAIRGSHARLQLGKVDTPFYVPRLTASLLPGERRLRTELNLGRATDIGNFLNVAQWLRVFDNVDVAPRIYATTQQGVGFGFDSEYNFMNDPASALYRSEGRLQTLYTTEDNGYTHWYHRQEFTPDTVMLGQWEQWYDQRFYKDFYNSEYENRTGPRSFASVTHTQPTWLATGTVAKATHDFTTETEKLPELNFAMFERRVAGNLYGTFDTIGGFYETQPETVQSLREVTVGRLSYDWNVSRGFNVLPFVEVDGTYYSKTLDDEQDAVRASATVGVTAQARMQRSFAGIGHFTGFKHLIIPSATLSFRPDTTLDAEDTPRFDDYDDRPGRFRIESTIDNLLLGRNGPTGEIWPVARLTLYQGNDFTNEAVRSNDYEIELEVRPRPAWGIQAVGEMHDLDEDDDFPGEDFNRVLTYLFYDNKLSKNTINGRLGFAFTESSDDVLNQEILYGMGYRLTGKWSVAFEQRYDFERDELTRQTYSLRRKFHDWEVGLAVRDKETGVDIGIEINLVNFPEIGLGL